ncbi:methyl-accepting chemotaxis protein, partial [Piscinibacter sakaiensis]|uniref:methyl-accepting chemotaxis protein n=1 Tax=Piscinibacter sakaiensis TaxID=1547922 RepID=UPI000AB4E0A8
MIARMTVAKRLALGFGLTVALGLGIVGYAATTLRAMSHGMDELAHDRIVKVEQFAHVKDNVNAVARHARNIVIQADPAAAEPEKARMAALRADTSATLARLEPKITLPKGRALFRTLTETRTAYNAALDRVIALALQGDRAGAAALLVGEVRGLQDTLFEATEASKAMQQEIADQLAREALRSASFGLALMAGLALLMAAVGGLVGWIIIRDLRRSLGAEPAALSEAVSRVADGDLSQPLGAVPGDDRSVLASVARMQASLAGVVSNVRSNSESVATASAQIAQGNHDLSQRTEEQASALQQTAATMEQLNTTVRHNADNARQANQLAQGASAIAAQGGQVVGQVVDTMQGISDSSRKIGDIIGVIDGIAFQTNILALNAAVEAARAGEQGRGF